MADSCRMAETRQHCKAIILQLKKKSGKPPYNGILLGHKMNKILPSVKGIMLSEISQKEKYKYHIILFICGI